MPFVRATPSDQTAIDAVGGWVSRLPLDVVSGDIDLFSDPRMAWGFQEQRRAMKGGNVLELGPLEGAHSYMAQHFGAAKVTAVESNSQSFLKCLVTKELLGLDRCHFLCGDAIEFMEASTEQFDLCVAAGVLYHQIDPVRFIDLTARRATHLVMWTHYYDGGSGTPAAYEGFEYEVHRRDYGDTAAVAFSGGTEPYANWLSRPDLFRALEYFGWRDIRIAFEDEPNPNGPALALVAKKSSEAA